MLYAEGPAQQITGSVLREVYLTFAVWTSAIAIGMAGVALFLSFIGL